MYALVLSVLPVLPHPAQVIQVEKTMRVSAMGRSYLRTVESNEFASNALGNNFWDKHAFSVDDVVKALEKKGFIVNHVGTVAMALNAAKYRGNVRAVRCTKPEGGRGSSYCRYFVQSS